MVVTGEALIAAVLLQVLGATPARTRGDNASRLRAHRPHGARGADVVRELSTHPAAARRTVRRAVRRARRPLLYWRATTTTTKRRRRSGTDVRDQRDATHSPAGQRVERDSRRRMARRATRALPRRGGSSRRRRCTLPRRAAVRVRAGAPHSADTPHTSARSSRRRLRVHRRACRDGHGRTMPMARRLGRTRRRLAARFKSMACDQREAFRAATVLACRAALQRGVDRPAHRALCAPHARSHRRTIGGGGGQVVGRRPERDRPALWLVALVHANGRAVRLAARRIVHRARFGHAVRLHAIAARGGSCRRVVRTTIGSSRIHARSTGYAPSYARSLHTLPSQIATFRRGDSTLVVAAWDARRDTTMLGRPLDAALVLSAGANASVDRAPPAGRCRRAA